MVKVVLSIIQPTVEYWDRIVQNLAPHTQFECGKLRTRKTLNTDTFHAVPVALFLNVLSIKILAENESTIHNFKKKKKKKKANNMNKLMK